MSSAEHINPELFTRLASGDELAFRDIFAHFTPRLLPGVIALVKDEQIAHEIIQDTFLQLWLKRAEVGVMQHPGGWLLRVAANYAKSHLRKLATHVKWYDATINESASSQIPEDRLTVKQLQQQLREAIAALPEKRREIFLLSKEEGLSHDEISHRLGISKTTVMNQLSLALKSIQEKLKGIISISILFYLLK